MARPSRRRFIGYLVGFAVSALAVQRQALGEERARGSKRLSIHDGWVLRADDLERLARR